MSHSKETIKFGTHKLTIYKRSDVIDSSYSMRIYLKDEERYFKKCLHTKDKHEAIEKAQTELINMLAKVQAGERIISISVRELLKRFQVHQQGLGATGQLSVRTVASQARRLRILGMGFLMTKYSPDVRLSTVNGEVFKDYLGWRQEKKPTIRRDVVQEELQVIRKMFLWGKAQKLCSEKAIPVWDFAVEKEGSKRQRITDPKQFSDYINTAVQWTREAKGRHEVYNRYTVLQIITLVALSGMRSGEVFGLKNSDVVPKGGNEFVLTIRAETSKVRRSRTITVVSTPFESWMNQFQVHKGPNAYVYCPMNDADEPVKNIFYQQYSKLRERLKSVGLDWMDLYHCRHQYITTQLLLNQPIHLVARVAGTSVAEIESTYSHVLTEKISKAFTEKMLKWNADGSSTVVTRGSG